MTDPVLAACRSACLCAAARRERGLYADRASARWFLAPPGPVAIGGPGCHAGTAPRRDGATAIAHLHRIVTLQGGRRPSPAEAEAQARDLTNRLAAAHRLPMPLPMPLPARLEVLQVDPAAIDDSGVYRVDLAARRLVRVADATDGDVDAMAGEPVDGSRPSRPRRPRAKISAMVDVDGLERYLRERADRDGFSGVVLITRGDARLFAGAYGFASHAWRVPNTLATRFDTASVTKLFTAVAALQLVDQGALALDTRVVEFLDLRGSAISPDVTVRQLLTHTSGIADDAEEEAGEDYADNFRTVPTYSVTRTADFLPFFAHKPPNFPPGAGCRYCNAGYILLGLLIERASGLGYRDYVRRHVFARAGMARSDFFRMDVVAEDVAEGCDPLRDQAGAIVGWRRNVFSYPPVGEPAGGAHVTAGDLDRFLRRVRAGKLLSAGSTAAFFTPQVLHHDTGDWDQVYGYGPWFAVDRAGTVLFAEKEGVNAGVSAAIRHYPDRDVNVVLLGNTPGHEWTPVEVVHRMLTGG